MSITPSEHPHHGLTRDLQALDQLLRSRRKALRWLGAGAALPLVGCGGGGDAAVADTTTTAATGSTAASTTGSSATTGSTTSTANATSTSSSSGTTGTTGDGSCSQIPNETAGPYPGDGTNSNASGVANVLTQSGIVRSDITGSFGGASGTASGIPLTLRLQIVNSARSCASLAGFAVYVWHADALGRYSMYSSGATGANYLRGVQVTDSSGYVTFTSIFPGCYDGRWPHIHFEIFPSLASATSGSNDIKTSQLALPQSVCQAVYADAAYSGSASNLSRVSLASDNVFSDGSGLQLASVNGSNSAGYVATLTVGVSA